MTRIERRNTAEKLLAKSRAFPPAIYEIPGQPFQGQEKRTVQEKRRERTRERRTGQERCRQLRCACNNRDSMQQRCGDEITIPFLFGPNHHAVLIDVKSGSLISLA